MDDVFKFLVELDRCEQSSPLTQDKDFTYNGYRVIDGPESYEKHLANFFWGFKAGVKNYSEVERNAIREQLYILKNKFYDVPTREVIEAVKNELATNNNPNLRSQYSILTFVKSMRGVQDRYIDEALNFLNTMVAPNAKPIIVEDVSNVVEERPSTGYLSLDEVVKKYGVPKSAKDRKWRRKNGFPMGNDSRGCKLIFDEEEVKQWVKNRNKS